MTDTKLRMKKAIYVVLLCIAIAMSTFAVWNTLHVQEQRDNPPTQITLVCTRNEGGDQVTTYTCH